MKNKTKLKWVVHATRVHLLVDSSTDEIYASVDKDIWSGHWNYYGRKFLTEKGAKQAAENCVINEQKTRDCGGLGIG